MADKPTPRVRVTAFEGEMRQRTGQPAPTGESHAEVWTPPSQMPPPQYPAIKPGEPIPYGERTDPEPTTTPPPTTTPEPEARMAPFLKKKE